MNAFTAAVMESKVLRNEYYKDSGTIDYEEEARGTGEGGRVAERLARRIIGATLQRVSP